MFKTIKEEIEASITEKKSKFICHIYHIESVEEAEKKLEEIRKKYHDARHNCYAYKIEEGDISKASDDGEPSGTAGMPILNILKKNNLTNVLAVVIRYFGGIKLGAGGLVRAYSNSIAEALKLTEGYLIELEFSYDQVKLVDYMLNDKKVIEKLYNDNIIYKFYLNNEQLNFVPELEKIAIHVSIKDKILIEKD